MIEFVIFLQVVTIIGGPLLILHVNKRVGAYASEVGKITAITNKIDAVVEQQKKITKATEEAKAEIGHSSWSKKEAITTRCKKLEEYLDLVFDTIESIRKCAQNAGSKDASPFHVLPMTTISKLTTLQLLYFPELEENNRQLTSLIKQFESIYGDFLIEKIDRSQFEKDTLAGC